MSETHGIQDLTPPRPRALVTVAATGRSSSSTNSTGVSQSAASRSVATAEVALGITLFGRSTRTVGLTAVGREIVEHARVVIAELTALPAFGSNPSTCSR